MKIADQQPSKTNLKQFLENQSNRTLIISTLMQALSSFGYKKSLESLRKQTNVVYQRQHLETIQNSLKAYQYNKLPELIKELRLPSSRENQILQEVQELQLFYLFKIGEINEVLNQIQTVNLSEEKMIRFYSMLALDSFESHQKDFLRLQQSILTKCKTCQKQKSQAKSILLSYLTKDSISYRRINNDIPKIVSAQSIRTNEINLNVSFIKLNQRLNSVIVVGKSKSRDQLQLSEWTIKNETIKPVCTKWTGSIGLIQSIKWRQTRDGGNSYIGICSFEHLIVYKDGFEDLVLDLSAKELEIGRFLSFDFDMNEEIIYVGGLFNKLMIFDFGGELVSEIKPFKMVRDIIITPKRDLLAIEAVKKGGLFRYQLSAETQTKLFQTNLPFMDLKLQSDKIIVTNNAFIYIIDYDTFETIATIQSPQNKRCFQIQAFFCGSWIIIYNEKLKGILVNGSVIKQHRWQQNFDAVDVVGTKMVTYSQSRIKLWQASSTKAMVSQCGSSSSVSSEEENEQSWLSDSSGVDALSHEGSQEDRSEENNQENAQLMEIEPIDSEEDSQDSQSS